MGSIGIRVNVIAPGLVDTHFAQALTSNEGLVQTLHRPGGTETLRTAGWCRRSGVFGLRIGWVCHGTGS